MLSGKTRLNAQSFLYLTVIGVILCINAVSFVAGYVMYDRGEVASTTTTWKAGIPEPIRGKAPDIVADGITQDTVSQKPDQRSIHLLINQARAEQGLTPLLYNERLEDGACKKLDHMVINDYWSHNAPDGTTPWEFFKQVGYVYKKVGENLAYGYRTSDAVVEGWMNSTGHRKNILGEFKEEGICVKNDIWYQGKRTNLIVQFLGTDRQ